MPKNETKYVYFTYIIMDDTIQNPIQKIMIQKSIQINMETKDDFYATLYTNRDQYSRAKIMELMRDYYESKLQQEREFVSSLLKKDMTVGFESVERAMLRERYEQFLTQNKNDDE